MNAFFDVFDTPVGPFAAAVNPDGAIVGTAFGDERALQARIPAYSLSRDADRLRDVQEQVLAFLSGERGAFDLDLAPAGTRFQRRVWAELQRIPSGETRTYGQVALAVGQPTAARAVGRANATNPICLIVPCHRVIGANGSLTGFAFGERIKRQLLDLEQTAKRLTEYQSLKTA